MKYKITTEKSKIDIERVYELLNKTYWASNRTLKIVKRSIDNSLCISVFDGELLIGFARIVTDYATFFWLCDVIVDKDYRAQGIGIMIMNYISELDFYNQLKGILATNDAHGLYEKYGFKRESDKFMSKDRGVYKF